MQENLEDIRAAGIELVGISYDSQETLASFARKHGVEYPLLSDAGSRTIDAYDIRNEAVRGTRVDGIPLPGTIIVDRQGIVRATLFHEGYKKRHFSNELIAAARAAREGSTPR